MFGNVGVEDHLASAPGEVGAARFGENFRLKEPKQPAFEEGCAKKDMGPSSQKTAPNPEVAKALPSGTISTEKTLEALRTVVSSYEMHVL